MQDGPDYHLFYLQAPWEYAGREIRHWYVSIGHAVSQNLRDWEILPDAFSRSREGERWDNFTTWTGCVIQHQGLWYQFYTGTTRSEKGGIQRIGLATSPDLISWTKHPENPLIVLDPEWYETLDLNVWHDQAWRDPWVFQHPETGRFHAFITARSNTGPPDGRGVIGHARSVDLLEWEVLPPVSEPGEFGYLEVPQLVPIHQRYYLLFSVPARFHSEIRCQRITHRPVTGTHYLMADSPLGPFRLTTDEFLVGDPTGLFYSGKLVQGPDKSWNLLAFYQYAPDGSFIGELTEPIPVEIHEDGALSVNWEAHGLSMAEILKRTAPPPLAPGIEFGDYAQP